MQDFKHFDYVIDFDGIIKAVKDGQKISVIINGEYYDFEPKKGVAICQDMHRETT